MSGALSAIRASLVIRARRYHRLAEHEANDLFVVIADTLDDVVRRIDAAIAAAPPVTVWVVTAVDYGDFQVKGVYATEAVALEAVKHLYDAQEHSEHYVGRYDFAAEPHELRDSFVGEPFQPGLLDPDA